MVSNCIINSKKKLQSMSRVQALISFTAFAVLLSPLKAYGMDLPDISDPEAQFVMSNKYARGEGVEKDAVQALKYLSQAADQGHAKANFVLGEIFEEDDNIDLAYKYYHIAADLGDPEAQFELGLSYLSGTETENALKYFNLAADQDDVGALVALGSIYNDGKFMPQDSQKVLRYLSSKPIREYVPSSDRQDLNHTVRMVLYAVGNAYKTGIGVSKDLKMAFHYYNLSANQGYAQALYDLADMYDNNAEILRSYFKAEIQKLETEQLEKIIEKERVRSADTIGTTRPKR